MLHADWLRAFVVFSQHRNLTRAARALGLSQPALHAQLQKLGEQIGFPLYRREGRALQLTEAGHRTLAYARESAERAAAFVAELRGEADRQPVVLAAGEGAYLYLLGEGLRRFARADPAPLRLLTRNREETVAAVLSGEAQLGVAVLDAIPEGVEASPLAAVPQVLAMRREHRLARRRTLSLRDLAEEPLIAPPAPRPHRAALGRALLAAGVQARVAIEANGWELMLHFVRLGLGVAVVNGCCRLPSGTVARPLRDLPALHYQVFSRAGRTLPSAALTLRRLLLSR